MGKPQSKRRHRDQVENARPKQMTAEQVRAAKNQRTRMRNLERKKERREEAEARNERWAKLSPAEQLKELNKRGVRARKQRRKIKAAMKEE